MVVNERGTAPLRDKIVRGVARVYFFNWLRGSFIEEPAARNTERARAYAKFHLRRRDSPVVRTAIPERPAGPRSRIWVKVEFPAAEEIMSFRLTWPRIRL